MSSSTSNEREREVTVVGAGLAGTLIALFMAQRGYEVKLFERRPDMRRADIPAGRSINLALSTRGLRALKHVGLDQKVLSGGIPMRGRRIHGEDGELTFQPYGKEGQAIQSVSRFDLNVALLDLASESPHIDLRFDTRCLDVDLDNATPHFEGLEGQFDVPSTDVVIGADGAYSAVRLAMQMTPRFNFSQSYLKHGYKELTIPPTHDGEFAIEPNVLHIWPRHSYMLIALPNQDRTFTCTLFLPFEGENSFATLDTSARVGAFFDQHFPDAVPLLPRLEEEFFGNPTGLLATMRCQPYHRGHTVLIGDAAHAVVPFYGQGMNAAFEDCTILEQLLNEFDDDWEQVLAAFSARRKADADAIADLALANFHEMQSDTASAAFLLRKRIEKVLHDKFPDLFVPLYTMVTFSNMPYSQAQERARREYEWIRRLQPDRVKALLSGNVDHNVLKREIYGPG